MIIVKTEQNKSFLFIRTYLYEFLCVAILNPSMLDRLKKIEDSEWNQTQTCHTPRIPLRWNKNHIIIIWFLSTSIEGFQSPKHSIPGACIIAEYFPAPGIL